MKNWISVCFVILFSLAANTGVRAQWVPSQGLDGAPASGVAVIDSTVFIASGGNGIFSRNISGGSWNQQLPGMSFKNISRCGNALFTWGYSSCYRSLDHGVSWESMAGWWNTPDVYSLCCIDSILFITLSSGIYKSFDYGNSIYPIVNHIPPPSPPNLSACGGSSLFSFQHYAGSGQTVYIYESNSLGSTWDSVSGAGLPASAFGITTICRFGGSSWLSASPGMNLVATGQQRTFASPAQNGLWYCDGLLTGIAGTAPSAKGRLTTSPNPAKAFVNVSFNLPESSSAAITITGMTGNVLYNVERSWLVKGIHTERVGLDGFSPGLYIVSLHTGNSNLNCKLQVLK